MFDKEYSLVVYNNESEIDWIDLLVEYVFDSMETFKPISICVYANSELLSEVIKDVVLENLKQDGIPGVVITKSPYLTIRFLGSKVCVRPPVVNDTIKGSMYDHVVVYNANNIDDKTLSGLISTCRETHGFVKGVLGVKRKYIIAGNGDGFLDKFSDVEDCDTIRLDR